MDVGKKPCFCCVNSADAVCLLQTTCVHCHLSNIYIHIQGSPDDCEGSSKEEGYTLTPPTCPSKASARPTQVSAHALSPIIAHTVTPLIQMLKRSADCEPYILSIARRRRSHTQANSFGLLCRSAWLHKSGQEGHKSFFDAPLRGLSEPHGASLVSEQVCNTAPFMFVLHSDTGSTVQTPPRYYLLLVATFALVHCVAMRRYIWLYTS